MRVKVFTKSSCAPCSAVKTYLTENNIPFEEINCFDNPEEPIKYGVRSCPTTILFEGEEEVFRVKGATDIAEVAVRYKNNTPV